MTHAITVDGVGKQFRLGRAQTGNMLREAIVDLVRSTYQRREPSDEKVFWALRDLSFSLDAGEVLGIVGRNGAGKSTLLKVLSRITRPTTGSVHIRGKVASLLEVGTGFHEELTGRENIYLSGNILGMSKRRIDAKLDEIVAFAEIDRFLDTPIKRYSSGMRMRLGFAVAANLESDILIVDEVLAVGDGDFQRKCLERMGDMHNSGRTVLFVSHNIAAVLSLCSRAIWLESGRLKQSGVPADVVKSYLSTFSSSEGAVSDLSTLTERTGTGDIRFTKIEYLNLDRATPAVVSCGDSFVIRLHIEAAREVQQPIFGIEIQTSQGIMAAHVHTYNSGYEIPVVHQGPSYIDVQIDDLNLMPGRYVLSLYAANLGFHFHDVLPQCTVLDVQTSNRYGLMRGLLKDPLVIFDCHWQVNEGAAPPLALPSLDRSSPTESTPADRPRRAGVGL
jgi:lipopolysaccharide transport system ATP-binding protein